MNHKPNTQMTTETITNPHAAGDAAHTPSTPATSLPWFMSADYKHTVRCAGSGPGAYVCTMAGNHESMEQNAAFIVRACNSHAQLVEALAMAQERIAELSKWAGVPNEGQTQDEISAALEAAQ